MFLNCVQTLSIQLLHLTNFKAMKEKCIKLTWDPGHKQSLRGDHLAPWLTHSTSSTQTSDSANKWQVRGNWRSWMKCHTTDVLIYIYIYCFFHKLIHSKLKAEVVGWEEEWSVLIFYNPWETSTLSSVSRIWSYCKLGWGGTVGSVQHALPVKILPCRIY